MGVYELWADFAVIVRYIEVFASLLQLLVTLAIVLAVFINGWW